MARHLDDLGILCGRSHSVAAESREIELPVSVSLRPRKSSGAH